MSNFHHQPGDFFRTVMTQYCSRWITAILQLIVDYTGSIGNNVSQALAELLVPLVVKTKYHVKNAKHLADELKDLKLDEEDMFVSHDVVSLFTNTPILRCSLLLVAILQ